tara:strand:+ start:2604 stop:3188 length:585 start_codon:yes stop_codon:yes gene_type:complete
VFTYILADMKGIEMQSGISVVWRWRVAVLYLVFVYLTLPFARDIGTYLRSLEMLRFTTLMIFIVVVFTAMALNMERLKTMSLGSIISIVVYLILSFSVFFSIDAPEERLHIVEYSVMAWMFHWALKDTMKEARAYLAAFAITFFAGCGDEVIQYFLPDRYYDFRDVLFNAAGASMGILFAWLMVRTGDAAEVEK